MHGPRNTEGTQRTRGAKRTQLIGRVPPLLLFATTRDMPQTIPAVVAHSFVFATKHTVRSAVPRSGRFL